MRKLSLILALGMLLLTTPALAHDVPNDSGWHTHDGLVGAGAHHKPVVFFPALFLQEGLGVYGVDVEYVDCPNATDKSLLAPGGKGEVRVAGICMNDEYVIHLLSGVDAPQGWETVTYGGGQFHYRLTPRR